MLGGKRRRTLLGWGGLLAVGWASLTAAGAAQVEAENQLRSADPKMRERAVRELGESHNPAYVPVLGQLVRDPDDRVRMTVIKALIRMGTPASLPPLCAAVRDGLPEIRYLAIDGLVNYYLPGYVDTGFGGMFRSAVQRFQNLFSDVDTTVVDADTRLDPAVLETLGNAVKGAPDMQTRIRAARALGILRARDAVPALLEAAFSNQVELIEEVLRAFQKIQEPSVGPRIQFLLHYPQESIQRRATITLGLLRTREAIPQLRTLLENSPNKNVRIAALEALSFMPTPENAPLFAGYLEDREKQMRAAAALALGRLPEANYSGILLQARQKERDASVRLALAFGLVANGRMEFLEELISSLDSRVRVGEARPYLIELARKPAVREELYPHLYAPEAEIRKNLCMVLAASGDATSVSYLEVLLRDSDPAVVQEASRAIRIIRSRQM
ncbi:MAG TPA: HEAT repeat domain-containing protein [Terriglobia bacterium]|nr:HEAT repeat domain-containing protein [Terriglobia bacterium]